MSRGGLRERHRGGGGRKGVRGGIWESLEKEIMRTVTLACLWMPSCLPLRSLGLLRLGGGAVMEVRARRVAFVATLSRGPGL